jgi:valyl-tRNA synthetase
MPALDNLSTVYEPQKVEPPVRQFWMDGRYFHADPTDKREAYTIVIPPPNVTGALHGGHALNNTLQDILVRWRRMQGFNTLWMPGTDHAGIATQAVVEKRIFENEHKNRHDLGRDELVRRIWEWKEQYGNRIIEQLKLMGCSCDWERTRFTLDEICARAVRHTFFNLFRDGLIVRGKRLVNWDTQLQTAVADDEVYHETVKGHFYNFKYPVKDARPGEPEFVHIATTRPETMLGDTAVAVHPEPDIALNKAEADLKQQLAAAPERERAAIQASLDELAERRKTLLPTLLKLRDMARDGRKLILPLANREIPLIADVWAKPELGSGAVKITPAHDPNDYEVGQRHGLAMVNVMTLDGKVARVIEPDGSVNANSARYEGLKFAAEGRHRVVEDLKALGLVENIEERSIELGHSDRSKTPIEPFLSDQWFVRMGDLPRGEAERVEGLRGEPGLAQLAMGAVCQEPHESEDDRIACGKVHFFPARYAKTYLDWLGEKRDWCISRQLWWGHRIPIWYCSTCSEEELMQTFVGRDDVFWRWDDDKEQWLISADQDNLAADAVPGHTLTQDPDVLDTWFSSALWPHSTLGWPERTPELSRYYPGDVLSTAREIITLWVARMVLTGLYDLGEPPFHDVYIHAVIQDGQGRPFKKTLGNGFDPVDIIDFYGADALRYTMATMSTETQDIRMPMKKVKLEDGRTIQTSERFELGRNFCNKIWNAARFAFITLTGQNGNEAPEPFSPDMKMSAVEEALSALALAHLPIEDRWILSRVSAAAREVQDALAKFQFSRAAGVARDFFWDSLCDWYLELVKLRIREDRQAAEARQVLAFALDQAIRLLHPFIPYITEHLWSQLNRIAPRRGLPDFAEPPIGDALVVAAYPPVEGWPALDAPEIEGVFADLQTVTRAVREVRQTQNVPPKQTVNVTIRVPAERVASMQREAHVIEELANVGHLAIDPSATASRNDATLVVGDMQIFVHDVIDPAAERQRLEKELSGVEKQIASIAGKLGNDGFVSRAPADVVANERQKLADLEAKRETMRKTIADLA